MAAAGAASVAVSLPASWYSVGRFTDEARPAAAMGLRWAGDDSTALVGFSDVALLAVAMGVLVVSLVRDDVRTARRTWPMFVPVMVVPVLMATGSRSSNIEFSLWMGLALAGLVAIGFGIASSDREPHGDFERVDRPTADRPTEAVDASNASADDAHGEPVPLLDRLTVAAAGAGWLVYGAVTALLVAALAAPIGDPAGGSITIYADAAETIERFLRGLTISWHVVVGLVLLVRTAAEPRATWSRPFTVLLSVLPVVLVSSGMLVA